MGTDSSLSEMQTARASRFPVRFFSASPPQITYITYKLLHTSDQFRAQSAARSGRFHTETEKWMLTSHSCKSASIQEQKYILRKTTTFNCSSNEWPSPVTGVKYDYSCLHRKQNTFYDTLQLWTFYDMFQMLLCFVISSTYRIEQWKCPLLRRGWNVQS